VLARSGSNVESKSVIKKLASHKVAVILIAVLLIGAAWFLIRRTGSSFKVIELRVAGNGKTGFTLLPPQQTGITFANSLRDDQETANQLLNIGSGVAAGDYDGDGLCDLYFCGMNGRNVLYKNLGNWKFEDVT